MDKVLHGNDATC